MTFARCSRSRLLHAPACLPGFAHFLPAQHACSAACRPRPARVQPRPAPHSRSQAYTLPPDKLAKAIALSRIRNIMDIVGGLWGIAVLWLLLATRVAPRALKAGRSASPPPLDAGTALLRRLLRHHTLASLPLDSFSQHVEKSYGISVQGWGSWLGDQAKALGLTLALRRARAAALQLDRPPLAPPLLVRHLAGHAAAAGALHLRLAAARAHLQQLRTAQPESRRLVAKLETVVARTGTNIPPDRMFLMKASDKYNGINAYVSRHRRHQAHRHVGHRRPTGFPTTKSSSSSATRAATTSSTTFPK